MLNIYLRNKFGFSKSIEKYLLGEFILVSIIAGFSFALTIIVNVLFIIPTLVFSYFVHLISTETFERKVALLVEVKKKRIITVDKIKVKEVEKSENESPTNEGLITKGFSLFKPKKREENE